MQRLLCIVSEMSAGGAETFLMKVSRSIPVEQCQFDFVVSKDGGVYTEEILKRGGKIYVIPPRRENFLESFKGLYSIVKKNKYECVLKLGDSPIVAVDLVAAKLGGAKRLGFRSCNALTGLSVHERVMNFIMRPILNRIANIKLAPSKLAANFTFGKRWESKVHILHNGVDLKVFHFDIEGRMRIREEFSLNDKFVVGHIGRFHKQKNHKYLLEIFSSIKEKRKDAILLLVGTGELEDSIKEWVSELGLEANVIFAGIRFDIPQILSAMDVFVFPSFHEGMPNTVIEAQSTGLPCIIADTITKDADITGLVKYLSLSDTSNEWAELALNMSNLPRKNTFDNFIKHGYNIEAVSKELISLFYEPENV